jgi:hypothetical protein
MYILITGFEENSGTKYIQSMGEEEYLKPRAILENNVV